jgi:ankyrin repeat protein
MGAEINLPHNNGTTVLLAAALRRDVKMMKILFELGADPDIENFDGWSARKWAKSESNPALMAVFGPVKEKETDSESGDESKENAQEVAPRKVASTDTFWIAFMRAAATGDLSSIRRLADDGVEVNGQSPNGTTALIAAAKNGQKDTVLELIELGADLNLPDEEGLTALAWAAKKGQALVVQTLKDKGADENTSQSNDEVPPEMPPQNPN